MNDNIILSIDKDYRIFLTQLKDKVRRTQLKASIAANTILVDFYWELGKEIVRLDMENRWGAKLIDQLSVDLRLEFSEVKGFSRRNLYAIRQWYLFFSSQYEFVPQAVAQLPWGHQRLIINKIKDVDLAVTYAKACLENSWSRDTLEANILSDFHLRIGNSQTNFSATMPALYSDLANQTIKNPYYFDFIEVEDERSEREIEKELVKHISEFMVELGKGFAFVGKQYNIVVNNNDYYIDLLFYHIQLRCYVVFELKAGKFKPEYAGKLNFYISAVDSQLKHPIDNSTIGIILCRTTDSIEVEYALRDIQKPIGISNFELQKMIPDKLKSTLPTIEEIEKELLKND
jgi:predicted nuclease of restriction endonuclease-like (RecB) superfamily